LYNWKNGNWVIAKKEISGEGKRVEKKFLATASTSARFNQLKFGNDS
jgi:hypothetical protein